MKIKEFFVGFSITFVLVSILNTAVVYGYNMIVHSEGKFEWQTTLIMAISFGVIVPLVSQHNKKKENR